MTPSPTRPTFPRTASRPARRTTLLAASALIGSFAGGVATMLAQPSLAQTLPGVPGAGSITVSSGGSQPLITAPNANTLEIDLNAPRTVINWASLNVGGTDAMNFHFDANSDIVLNKTTSQITIASGGTVTGKVGAATGGNIWFYSPQGVIVSPGAVMTAGGFLFSRGSGINDVSFVGAADPLANLRAATDALIRINSISSATSASIDASGNVLLSASSGALNVGIAAGATVGVSTTSGSITASEVTATSGAATVAAGGPGATVSSITGATGVTVSSGANTSVGLATTTTSGDIVLGSGGSVSLTLGNSARDTLLTAPLVFLSTLDAGRDAILTGDTGVTVTNRIFAGDDIELTASNGDITAGGAFLRSTGLGASDDAHILLRSNTGSVTATNTLQTQGTGAQAGDITVQAATTASVGTATATRDLKVNGVTASLTNGSAARDVFVTATTGGVTVTTAVTAGDDVEVTATTGAISASGATLTSTGVGAPNDAHLLARSTGGAVNVGSAITQGTGAAAGDVIISAATTATLGSGDASRDLTISGVTASLTSGTAVRDVFVTATTGGATVVTSATAGDDVEITATSGAVAASGATLTSTGVGASNDAHVLARSTSGAVDVGTAITQGTGVAAGDVTLTAGDTATATALEATRDVSVTAPWGIAVGSATAARDITLYATVGDVTLGKAELTGSGAGHDLSVTGDGNVTFGAPDYLSITSTNTFSRTGGNTGTVLVRSLTADAHVYLDTSATIDTLTAVNIDATISNGPMTFGTLTAQNDLYVETLDGGLTVGTVTAYTGDLDLYAYGGDLTATGSVHGAGLVHLQADGLVDGTAASLISSDGDLELIGGAVDAGHLTADGAIDVGAATGNALVQKAEAGQTVQVVALNGDATLRGGEGPDGVAVIAFNKATFGADDKASITAANAVVTDATCGCGSGGLQVMSYDGDVVVNIESASNGIALVGSAIDGDVTVVQKTGDLKIEEVAGYNITLEAMAGTLETGSTTSSGGDYAITAHDFLGDALTPFLFFGENHDVTITDTLGDLDLGTSAVHAGRKLTITAQGGAVTGLAQLDAGTGIGDGEVNVTATAIALDTVASDGNLDLNGGTGLVDVVTSVSVDNTYHLTGGDFSDPALAPLGAKAGFWSLRDQAGDFDFTGKTLRYGGSIGVTVTHGDVIGGDITSDTGAVYVEAEGGSLGALYGGGGIVTAIGNVGGMAVDSAEGRTRIKVTAAAGTASLGAAILTGPGAHNLNVEASNGDVVLGAASPGGITAGNVVTSTGSSLTLVARAPTGKIDVNLDHTTNASLSTVSALNAVNIKVVNGAQVIGDVTSTNGAVTIDGPTGALTVVGVTAGSGAEVRGGGNTNVNIADVTGDLTVSSATGDIFLGVVGLGALVRASGTVSLDAAGNIAEDGYIDADTLTVRAGTGVTLLDGNSVYHLGAVDVTAGGFAFHSIRAFDLTGPVNAVGQTVNLRSDHAITQAATGIITAQTLTGQTVGGASFDAANQIAELGNFTNTTSRLKLINNRSLTIKGTVLSTGTVSIASHGGMTFASTGTVRANGTGDAVVLASDGVFTNGRGADAVTAANAGGRWLIYTQAVGAPLGSTAGNTFNGLTAKTFYGSAYNFTTSSFAVGVNNGNRFVYAYQPTLTVTPNSQIVTYSGAIPTTSATVTGLLAGDLITDASQGPLVINGATSKAVGTYSLTVDVSGFTSDLNYAFAAGPAGSLRIDPKALTGLLDADDKTYDRTTDATGTVILTGVIAGDAVAAAGTYAFADWNAGIGKTVTASGVALSGADAGNYTLAPVGAGTADILQKSLTAALTAGDKTYDGTTVATGALDLTGVIAGDVVTAGGTYAFADKTADVGKTVTATGVTLSGGGAGNYSLGAVSADTADILRKSLTAALTADDKTYDGTAIATGTVGLTGVVSGDAVTAGGTYAFADKTAATGKTVTAFGVALSGGDAANYSLGAVSTDTADILKKGLTGALTADTRTYDGTFAATGSIGLTGVVAGDTVAASGTYAFADKTAATGKAVTASGVVLSGGDAANYTLAPLGAGSADILKRGLTGALTADTKTYDGTTTATGSIGLTGVVAGDAVSASGTYAFADPNAGVGKTVTVSGATLTGLDAANYDLGGVGGALADILRRPVTVAADNGFKPFGHVDPPLTYRVTVGSLVAGDAFAGGLAREGGEVPGGYGITRGTLDLSTNYDLTFTGATFTIRPLPSNEQDGSMSLKHIMQSPDFTLDWDPQPNLTTEGAACPGEGCPPQATGPGGGKAVAALR